MPLSATGYKILSKMTKTYAKKMGSRAKGRAKAKQVFYAMENEGKLTPKAFKRGRRHRGRRARRMSSARSRGEEEDVPPSFVSYTPTWRAAGTAPSLGNGTLFGSFWRYGKFVYVQIFFRAGSTTTFGSGEWSFDLPSQPTDHGLSQELVAGTARGFDNGVANYNGICIAITAAGVTPGQVRVMNPGLTTRWGATSPFTWGNTDELYIACTYEEAP